MEQLLVRAQHRQSGDAEVGGEAAGGRDALARTQAAVEDRAAKAVVDLAEDRAPGGSVER